MMNYLALGATIVVAGLVSGIIMFVGSMMIMKTKWFAKAMAKWAKDYTEVIMNESAAMFQDEEL